MMIVIGKYRIWQHIKDRDHVTIVNNETGESGSFSIKKLETIIEKFFIEEF